jgi:hypothetical protein
MEGQDMRNAPKNEASLPEKRTLGQNVSADVVVHFNSHERI